VELNIDANGILHVSAKDKNTGKKNKITIKSNSGLSDEEIEQMILDAEANAELDKKARELIEAKNSADSQVHTIRKDLTDFGDKLAIDKKTEIETALTSVEEAIKADDLEAINKAMSELTPTLAELMAIKYQDEAPQAAEPKDDSVVDAEFTAG
jgi:molecular chaperone DnaK